MASTICLTLLAALAARPARAQLTYVGGGATLNVSSGTDGGPGAFHCAFNNNYPLGYIAQQAACHFAGDGQSSACSAEGTIANHLEPSLFVLSGSGSTYAGPTNSGAIYAAQGVVSSASAVVFTVASSTRVRFAYTVNSVCDHTSDWPLARVLIIGPEITGPGGTVDAIDLFFEQNTYLVSVSMNLHLAPGQYTVQREVYAIASSDSVSSTNISSFTGIEVSVLPDTCPADFNGNGTLDVADIFAFLNAWFAGNPSANFDGLNGLQVADIFAFLNAWFSGC